MPEFYKKVFATQLKPTPGEKASIIAGTIVPFEGEPIKYLGGERFMTVLNIGQNLIPVHENQWLVREPELSVYWDDAFHAKFIDPKTLAETLAPHPATAVAHAPVAAPNAPLPASAAAAHPPSAPPVSAVPHETTNQKS